jgi:hypothetical protein
VFARVRAAPADALAARATEADEARRREVALCERLTDLQVRRHDGMTLDVMPSDI